MPRLKTELHGLRWSRSKPEVIQDLRVEDSRFLNCIIEPPTSIDRRGIVRNVALTRCAHCNCVAYGAIFEDVVVDTLHRVGGSVLDLWACVFKHVTLRGPISSVHLVPMLTPGWPLSSEAINAANQDYYRSVDWALDISDAKFGGAVSFPAVPHQLIRRNPRSQFIVLREDAPALVQMGLGEADIWYILAKTVLENQYEGLVMALGSRSKGFPADLVVAERLRHQGLIQ